MKMQLALLQVQEKTKPPRIRLNSIVTVERGRNKGTIGIVDDEAANNCIVVLTGPIGISSYCVVKLTSVRSATRKEREEFKRGYNAEMNAFAGDRH